MGPATLLRLVLLGGALLADEVMAGGARAIDRQDICVTSGKIEQLAGHRLGIQVPGVRAFVLADAPQAAEIEFTYLGPSAGTKPLASGEVRRQIGLKLGAQDTCNVLYVMWWIEPRPVIAVSIKRNPGQRTHAECGDHGYQNQKPRHRLPAPRIAPGSTHTLRAELLGRELRVWADGSLAWDGALPPEVEDFAGPVGLRTDNVQAELIYRVGGGPPTAPITRVPDSLRRRCAEGKGNDPD